MTDRTSILVHKGINLLFMICYINKASRISLPHFVALSVFDLITWMVIENRVSVLMWRAKKVVDIALLHLRFRGEGVKRTRECQNVTFEPCSRYYTLWRIIIKCEESKSLRIKNGPTFKKNPVSLMS